jgi:hypothetical protein
VLTRVWQKWRFSAQQKHLWLIKAWFSASTFVVNIATFAKPETVSRHCTEPLNRQTIRQLTEIKIVKLRPNELAKNKWQNP